MRKIYVYRDLDGSSPVVQFLGAMHPKLRRKVDRQLQILCLSPQLPGEPHIKHFQIERYRPFYELREKMGNTLFRIVFTCDPAQNILLLEPFLKTHKRSTNRALESALDKLRRIERGTATTAPYPLGMTFPH